MVTVTDSHAAAEDIVSEAFLRLHRAQADGTVFDFEYAGIAEVVGKSEVNCRQIAARARRHVDARRPRFEATVAKRATLAERFFAAVEAGDLGGLVDMLAADVVTYGDDGGRIPFDLCLWAGGFRVPALARVSGLAVNSRDRALVDRKLEPAVAGAWGSELAMGCRTGGFTAPKAADVIAARLTGREPGEFRYRYLHECISLGRRHGLIQFLNADESPKPSILTGRKAIAYKNATLNGAKTLFPPPGPRPDPPASCRPGKPGAGKTLTSITLTGFYTDWVRSCFVDPPPGLRREHR
jgi:hypothetical protein